MGQRLVISITQNEKEVAAIYYHWSGYTYSALQETKRVINCIYNGEHETMDRLLLRLIHHLEANGGGIKGDESELSYIQSLYPNETFKTDGYSRNDGIIALSSKGISDLQRWSEGDVFIDLDRDEVDFCVYSGYEDLDEYIEERESWDDDFDKDDLKNNIPKFDVCLGLFDITEIDELLHIVGGTDAHVIQCGDEFCELIE